METIKIAHLYYDLMNLYGEHGNIEALKKHLEGNKVKVITHYLTIDEKIEFDKYDLFYIGSGNKEAFQLVLEDILERKEAIVNAFKSKKFFIITGNAIDLFGKCYHNLEDAQIKCLDLLNYEAYETDFRIVGEQVYTFSKIKEELIGFQNRSSVLRFVKEPHLFEVKSGTGFVPKSIDEGIHKNNFFGTYLLGPIFIRNPYFTEYIVRQILKSKDIPYLSFQDEFEITAYQEYKTNMLKEEIK